MAQEFEENCCGRWIVRRHYLIVWPVILFFLGAYGLSVRVPALIADEKGGSGNFSPLDHPAVERFDAFLGLNIAREPDIENPTQVQEIAQWFAWFIFESKTGDMLTPNAMKAVRDYEKGVYNTEKFSEVCHKSLGTECIPLDSLNSLTPLFNQAPATGTYWSTDVTLKPESEWPTIIANLSDSTLVPYAVRNGSTTKAHVIRSRVAFGSPITFRSESTKELNPAPYVDQYDRPADQQADFSLWISTYLVPEMEKLEAAQNEFEVLVSGEVISSYFFSQIINGDLVFVILSLGGVAVVICLTTKSILLGLCGSIHIYMSYECAYFFYRTIFGYTIHPGMNQMITFIILGIGADDIFVFVDNWVRSHFEGPNVNRNLVVKMSFVYYHSAKTMFFTTLTTFAAFVATGLSPVPIIRTFGVYAAIVVLIDYIFVITYYPCLVLLWHRYFEFRHPFKCSKMAIPPNLKYHKWHPDHAAWAEAQASNPQGATPRPHTPAKMIEISPENAAMKKLAVDIEEMESKEDHSKSDTTTTLAQDSDDPKTTHVVNTTHPDDDLTDTTTNFFMKSKPEPYEDESLEVEKLLPSERFFRGPFFRFLRRGRYFILTFFTLLLIAGSIGASFMSEAGKSADLLADDHPITRAARHMSTSFSPNVEGDTTGTDDYAIIHLMYGLAERPIDRTGVDINAQKFKGKILFQPPGGFVLTEACMNFIADDCLNLYEKNLAFNMSTTNVCMMDVFRKWRASQLNNTVFANKTPDQQLVQWTVDQYPTAQAMGRFYYIENSALKWITSKFESTISEGVRGQPRRDQYQILEDWVAGRNALTGRNACTVAHSGELWQWMAGADTMRISTVNSMIVSMALAFLVLLLSTGNIIISVLAATSIIGVVVCVLSFMVLAGWSLDFIESICLTILVGIAVDYVVHLANTYCESKFTYRQRRTRSALTLMGTSVLSGAISSLTAGFMLFFTTFSFFQKFGTFMFLTIALSLFWSTCFFMTACLTIGAQGNEWDFWYKLINWWNSRNKDKVMPISQTSEP